MIIFTIQNGSTGTLGDYIYSSASPVETLVDLLSSINWFDQELKWHKYILIKDTESGIECQDWRGETSHVSEVTFEWSDWSYKLHDLNLIWAVWHPRQYHLY